MILDALVDQFVPYYTRRRKLHYMLRLVPFVEKNYNLVELGPRGTGKSFA